jgi:hypothetical protein
MARMTPDRDDKVTPIRADSDNEDKWSSGYAAGLRASGNTFIPDDALDPAVVVVKMLPSEFVESAVAAAHLTCMNRQLVDISRELKRLAMQRDAQIAALSKKIDMRIALLERRITALERFACPAAACGVRGPNPAVHTNGTGPVP